MGKVKKGLENVLPLSSRNTVQTLPYSSLEFPSKLEFRDQLIRSEITVKYSKNRDQWNVKFDRYLVGD